MFSVYNQGTAKANSSNIELLKNLDEKQILSFTDSTKIKYCDNSPINNSSLKDATYDCGTYKQVEAVNGKNKTRIEITYRTFSGMSNAIIHVRPLMKTLGIWYFCSRTISFDFKVAYDVDYGYGWERGYKLESNPGEPGSNYEVVIFPDQPSPIGFHFAGYDAWGATPSAGPAIIQCNTDLF